MPQPERIGRALMVASSFGIATYLALSPNRPGEGLFKGLYNGAQAATVSVTGKKGPYALSKAMVVQRTLELISDEYVDPKRVVPRDLLLSALNAVQRDVAQVLVQIDPNGTTATIRADDKEMTLKVDDVKGPWDVLQHIRTVFAFFEVNLKNSPEIDLRDIEYAACNGMLHTLDPHSVLFSPEAYKDFSVGTSGKFGGLGIVIAIRDKMLTVMNTMPGTPAQLAGLQKFDRIMQINGEATSTMGINEAVNRLRGDPKTDVTLFVHRDGKDGWAGNKPFKLTREEIKVASVESKGLEDGIGYIRLKQFAEQTSNDMLKAMADLNATGHNRGLILDLRGNPGGLLDQAKRVADAFVKDGVIVISDGRKEGREELTAKDDKNEPNYPIVVLVSSGSASASEIVAGALKNLDRAVIIGETSFGKGSVQKVEKNIPPEGAALKLTIAQYLTPGDISIQGIGITPDIELDPMTVDLQELDLDADQPLYREADLAAHLSNAKAKGGEHPLEIVKYDLSREDRIGLRERNGDPEDVFALDFQIAFSRKFLKAVGTVTDKRVELVKKAKGQIEAARAEEMKKVADTLTKVGVDWSDGDASGAFDPSKIKVEVVPSATGDIVAGEPYELKVTVTNEGTVPLYRLHAKTTSEAGVFDGKEFAFGRVDPGKSRTWTSPMGFCETEGYKPGSTATAPKDAPRVCRIPKDTVTRADAIKIRFEEAHEHMPAEAQLRTTIKALPKPAFAYIYQVVDDIEGNGDGQLQLGEKASLYLTVKNVGEGKSFETEASIHNLSGDGLLLHDARFDLSNMAPGEERRVRFTFDVQPALTGNEAKLQLAVRDADLRESANERVVMPIASKIDVNKMSGVLRAESTPIGLIDGPRVDARPFGQLPKDGALAITGYAGEFLRVDLGGGRFAFADKKSGKVGGGALPPPPKPTKAVPSSSAKKDVIEKTPPSAPTQPWVDLLSHSPPTIEVEALDLVTKSDKVKLKGFTTDGDRVLDAYVFVGARKIYYRSNKGGPDAKKEAFELEVPLRPGVNYVSVWARENSETVQRRVFVIRRDGPGGEILDTPKTDDDVFELLGGQE